MNSKLFVKKIFLVCAALCGVLGSLPIVSCGGNEPPAAVTPEEPEQPSDPDDPGTETPEQPEEPNPEQPEEPKDSLEGDYGRIGYFSYTLKGEEVTVECKSDKDGIAAIPSMAIIEGETYPVTGISDYGFRDISRLKALYIPSTIKNIGQYAFENTNISELHIEDLAAWCAISFDNDRGYTGYLYANLQPCIPISPATTLFVNDTPITDLTIPTSVVRIAPGAFYNLACTSITLPKGLREIGAYAFAGCTGITELRLPESVTDLDECAFAWCTSLEKLNLGNKIKTIGRAVFIGCSKIKSATLPESLKYGGVRSFDIATTKFHIPSINWWCQLIQPIRWTETKWDEPPHGYDTCHPYSLFVNGIQVTDLIIPGEINNIPDEIFSDNTTIRSVQIEEGVHGIGKHAFRNCQFITDVSLPASLDTIGKFAFEGCRLLTHLSICPGNLKKIPVCAFSGCSSLENVVIPEHVEFIDDLAFSACTSLHTIIIPTTIKGLSSQTFDKCSGITDIYIKATIPPLARLNNVPWGKITLHVPTGCLKAYQESEEWGRSPYGHFKDIIEFDPDIF